MATRAFLAFNTCVRLTAYGAAGATDRFLDEAEAACAAFERLFSRTLPGSDIWRLNHSGGEATAIDSRTFELLRAALHYCEASEGTFDITVGAMVDLWDFRQGIIPDPDALKKAAETVDWRGLHLWKRNGQCFAQLANEDARVDAGGIAKGWIADRLTALAAAAGCCGALVNLGGNIALSGSKPNGEPWRITIRDPQPACPASTLNTLEMETGSVVTSGTYERAFFKDGVRFHHILDPRTGYPASCEALSVTVVAKRSLDAEGFSTALLALGPKRSRALAARRPELLQAYFVFEDGHSETVR